MFRDLPDFVRNQSFRVVDKSVRAFDRKGPATLRQLDRATFRKMSLPDLSGLVATAGREVDPLPVARPAWNCVVPSRICWQKARLAAGVIHHINFAAFCRAVVKSHETPIVRPVRRSRFSPEKSELLWI